MFSSPESSSEESNWPAGLSELGSIIVYMSRLNFFYFYNDLILICSGTAAPMSHIISYVSYHLDISTPMVPDEYAIAQVQLLR